MKNFDLHFLIASENEHCSICVLLATYISFMNCLRIDFVHFSVMLSSILYGFVVHDIFYKLVFGCLYVLNISSQVIDLED